MLLKIGDLARRTGLTVRTLHYYDDIGLLRPSARSPSGYRLYDRRDIERLHCIQALRKLDIPLADISTLLEGENTDLKTVIEEQIAALDRQALRTAELRGRLATLHSHIVARQEPELEDWLATLSMMNFYDRHFTPQEIEQVRRAGRFDDTELRDLKETLRGMMESGLPADSPELLPLSKRWIALSLEHLANDARLIYKVDALHRNEPYTGLVTGIDPDLLDYITRATAEYRLSLFARHLDPADIARAREPFLKHYLTWPALFAEALELHERGADSLSPEVLDLAGRWMAQFIAVWGPDPATHARVIAVHDQEKDLIEGSGIDMAAVQMVRRAITHLREQQKEKS